MQFFYMLILDILKITGKTVAIKNAYYKWIKRIER